MSHRQNDRQARPDAPDVQPSEPDEPIEDITLLLNAAAHGDANATDELIPVVYRALGSLARRMMAKETPSHTLQPTALVHEAYLRLVKDEDARWENRRHFFGAAAEAMRRILIERARRYRRLKHGGEFERVPYDEDQLLAAERAPELIAMDEALTRLEARDARKAEIVKLRYFIGMTIEETAEALAVSPATVKLDWSYARAWLHREIRTATPDAWKDPDEPI